MELGSEVGIFVDGRSVGTAERVSLDAHRGRVTLEGLDALAVLFFATGSSLGAGPHDPPIGWVALCDLQGQWVDLPSAHVVSFSSGIGDLVLMSSGLHLLHEAPLQPVTSSSSWGVWGA